MFKERKQSKLQAIIKDFKTLFCSSGQMFKQLQVFLYTVVATQCSYLVLFGSSELKGNALVTVSIVAVAGSMGALVTPFIVKLLTFKGGVLFGCLLISASSYMAKFTDASPELV